ncbi:hypothetical protein C8J56DRAFT_1164473 [Mycena floridula]|nr:hypothetical protein C8J56DRAFT_1164473 [Mycena floridula]
MISAKFILATFSAFVTVSVIPRAGAAALSLRSEQASPTITVCRGTVSPPQGCVIIPVVSDNCISFTGGLSFLNNEVSGAQIPAGLICTFFKQFSCLSAGGDVTDVAVLTGGTWNMTHVEGVAGFQSFNNVTSSISCSAL